MFARHITASVKKGKLEEALKIYHESVVPEEKAHKGYRGEYILTDRETGKIVSISLWDTPEDAAVIDGNGRSLIHNTKFNNVLESPLVNEGYEVSLMLSKTK